MASKRHVRRKACEGKVKFTDQEKATKAAYSYLKSYGQYMHTYKCKFCSRWHIGHPPKAVRRALAARYER